MILIRQTLLSVLLFLSLATLAQKKEPVLLLKEGKVKTVHNITESTVEQFNRQAVRHMDKAFAVLQFERLPTAETRKLLSQQGIELLEYIPEHAYTVSVTGKLNAGVLKRAGARTILPLTPKQKMHAGLANGDIPGWAKKVKGMVDVWVSFPRSYKAGDVVQYLQEEKLEVLSTQHQAYRILEVRVSADQLDALASLPFIEYVEPIPGEAKPLNMNSRNAARAGVLNASMADGGKGLNGEGVVIGIGDAGDVQSHVDLTGSRLINKVHESYSASSHAIHVHTTAAGAGVVNELYRGYALKATLVSQAYTGIINNAGRYVQDYGMVLTNNSYIVGSAGPCGFYGQYTFESRILDQQSFDFPHLQHVFAAGNEGGKVCSTYPLGFHTVFGSYPSAKNVLTVGATEWNGAMMPGSGRGPVEDGRTKPEITAMGSGVYSGTLNNGYTYGWGTSFATPAVTGGMALLYQRYRQLHSGANPKNGLMKALLCNGGGDLGNKGPDFQYGFGWMNLLRSVEVLEKGHYKNDSLPNGAQQTYSITVPAGSAQLKVMLYWNDPPASPLSSRTLVNDLDLQVLDPSGTVNLPRVLDPSAAGVLNIATTGADHINNMEQVVMDQPAPGTYTLNISALVAQNPYQEYFIVYDIVPVSTTVTYPAGGERLVPGETVQINWDAYGEPAGSFALKFSSDGGANWTDIAAAIEATSRRYAWVVPNTPTSQALIRIERNGVGLSHTTQPFTILGVPNLSLAPAQCEGYIALNWTPVQGATDYEVMMKLDNEMVPVATTAFNSYALTGLSTDSLYWVSVRARVGGKPGRRAVALSRQPNSGTCAGTISDHDLKLDTIVSPTVGRKYTATELSSAYRVTIRVKNLDDEPVTGFIAKYKMGNEDWVTETINVTIPAGTTYDHTYSTTEDLSGVGSRSLVTVVESQTPDPVKANDTLAALVRQLDNLPLDLTTPFLDDLESAVAAVYTKDTMGLAGIERYDFTDSSSHGRLSTSNGWLPFSGTKNLVLGANKYIDYPAGEEFVTATYNLSKYNVQAHDIRLDFNALHTIGMGTNNRVWIRGRDDQSWIQLVDLELYPDNYTYVKNIELSDSLLKYGQNFSSSFQLKWSHAPGNNILFILDDIRIYEVFNDLQLLNINVAFAQSCGSEPLRIVVHNSGNKELTNVPVKFSIGGGAWVTELLPAIPANTSMDYTFTTRPSFSAPNAYILKALVDLPTDDIRANDTLSTVVNYAPLVKTFPYFQNFEDGPGGWYTTGTSSTWVYGTPSSVKINKAASGSKAWLSKQPGSYIRNESRNLYSPCFDISGMHNPMLSFSMAMDLFDCGTTCDIVWVEYSTNNTDWRRLIDTVSAGTNWYTTRWGGQKTHWHVATVGLPKHTGTVRLRFIRSRRAETTTEGLAIDDIHIYDSTQAIYEGVSPSVTATQSVFGSEWVHFESEGKLLASVHPNGQNLGSTEVQAFIHPGAVRNVNQQYYHNRSITIKPQNTALTDSVSVRMYFTDSETEALLQASGCSDCSKPASAYELGVSKYTDTNKSRENGEICDNTRANNWSFISGKNVSVVPFQKGYYIEFKLKDFSEFWLNSGGADQVSPLTSVNVPALASMCADDAGISLSATPAGGTWSGPGVSGGTFLPSAAGAGTHTLSYTYTGTNGCSAVATTKITVNPVPVITMPALYTLCVNASNVSLTATPAGGTWSGTGVSGSSFNPSMAGAGTHLLSYRLTNADGCTAVGTASVTVNALPVITMPVFPALAYNSAPLALSGAQPAGGTWSGRGVVNGVFMPAAAGVGTHTVTYSYSDAGGCSNQAAATIKVNSAPVKLLNFTVERTGMEDVRAEWTVQEEAFIQHYELELAKGDEALAAGQFARIAEVPSRRSNASAEPYYFTDVEPLKLGWRHYRLKMTAIDGSITYSEVRSVEFPVITWRIYPNPSSGRFYLTYQVAAGGPLEAYVYDANGRLVKHYRRQGSGAMQRLEVDLSASTFADGVYMLQTVTNGRKEFFKLLKL